MEIDALTYNFPQYGLSASLNTLRQKYNYSSNQKYFRADTERYQHRSEPSLFLPKRNV